jgi:hypothetical protein
VPRLLHGPGQRDAAIGGHGEITRAQTMRGVCCGIEPRLSGPGREQVNSHLANVMRRQALCLKSIAAEARLSNLPLA